MRGPLRSLQGSEDVPSFLCDVGSLLFLLLLFLLLLRLKIG